MTKRGKPLGNLLEIGGRQMIKKAKLPLIEHFDAIDWLTPVDISKEIKHKRKLFSEGRLNVYKGKGINKFVTLTVKGLNLYHYDFGIAYPEASADYPVFLYQVIIAPQRVLTLTHYAFYKPEDKQLLAQITELLEEDEYHSHMLLSSFKPQSFLAEDIIINNFNGLVRTTEIDEANESILDLFKVWHNGLIKIEEPSSEEETQKASLWTKEFCEKFYKEDYGYKSTSRYLGEKWAKDVFENYIFNID